MMTCNRQDGFTLLEVIVVLAVLGLLLGAAVPLASAVIESDRRQEARNELVAISTALDSYYFENASFPVSLSATDFFGVHLQPGVNNTVTADPFGGGQSYVYAVDTVNNVATVYSRGENGADDGATNEEFVSNVYGSIPGTRRTWTRLRIIVEVLANHIEGGGAVTGAWPALRASIGLGAEYDADGFGTTLQWDGTTHTLTSAGADHTFGTADDITI
ncbi:MAG: prepilin-type N-terminal cleavage/methylation domain-containing protein [Planctomycetes bacterium]|jgi:general secretion pathway protein G|nr:prepilin-type N-terminal cleavage/methylation domain-containing protein [Planctomycetota bacterium]